MSANKIIVSVIAVLMLAVPVLTIDFSDADSSVPYPVSGTEYTVTLDTNSNGQAQLETTKITTVNQKVSELPAPVWKEHTFRGWYTSPGDNGQRIAEDYVYSADTTLYAHWTENPNRYTDGPFDFTDPTTLAILMIVLIVVALVVLVALVSYSRRR